MMQQSQKVKFGRFHHLQKFFHGAVQSAHPWPPSPGNLICFMPLSGTPFPKCHVNRIRVQVLLLSLGTGGFTSTVCANSVSVFWLCAIPFLVVGEQRMRYPKIRFFCIWVTLGDNYLEKLKYTSKQIWRNELISATGHKDRILNFRLWVLLFFKIKSVGKKPRQEKTGKNITIKQRWGVSCRLPFTPSLVVKSLSS